MAAATLQPHMRFNIGGTFVQCSGCGKQDFFPALALSSGRRDVYVCAHCGSEVYYGELVRLGKEAARRAADAKDAPG